MGKRNGLNLFAGPEKRKEINNIPTVNRRDKVFGFILGMGIGWVMMETIAWLITS